MGKNALIIVDVLKDFVDGSLPVPDAIDIVPGIETAMESGDYDYIVCVIETHSEDHCSFIENGGKYPRHCVEEGSEPVYDLSCLDDASKVVVWMKGKNPLIDSPSAFYDDEGHSTGLRQQLDSLDVTEVKVCGLALEICVKLTAIDAAVAGFNTTVLANLCKALDYSNEAIAKCYIELTDNGVTVDTTTG